MLAAGQTWSYGKYTRKIVEVIPGTDLEDPAVRVFVNGRDRTCILTVKSLRTWIAHYKAVLT